MSTRHFGYQRLRGKVDSKQWSLALSILRLLSYEHESKIKSALRDQRVQPPASILQHMRALPSTYYNGAAFTSGFTSKSLESNAKPNHDGFDGFSKDACTRTIASPLLHTLFWALPWYLKTPGPSRQATYIRHRLGTEDFFLLVLERKFSAFTGKTLPAMQWQI